MTMVKQPDGIRRVPRGDAKPPDSYDIFLDEPAGPVDLGHTERLDKGWRAYTAGGTAWPDDSRRHTDAVAWLIAQHEAGNRTAEAAQVSEQESVRPAEAAEAAEPAPAEVDASVAVAEEDYLVSDAADFDIIDAGALPPAPELQRVTDPFDGDPVPDESADPFEGDDFAASPFPA